MVIAFAPVDIAVVRVSLVYTPVLYLVYNVAVPPEPLFAFNVIVVSINEHADELVDVEPDGVPPTVYPVVHVHADAELPAFVPELLGHELHVTFTDVAFALPVNGDVP